ncbi:MAG: HAMP domain-containing sensor histidine kinase [Gemmatimonadota bacterium]|nr:HAMP domain-containing sensor histidine kinase [Gemmatimonadota bacterium]
MASLRARTTLAFGATTIAGVALFGIVATFERRAATERDLIERTRRNAALAARIIERQGVQGVFALDTASTVGSMLNLGVTRVLDELTGYYVLVGDSTRLLYWSPQVRQIYSQAISEFLNTEQKKPFLRDLDELTRAVFDTQPRTGAHRVLLSSGDEVLVSGQMPDQPLPGGVRRIAVGVSTSRIREVTIEMVSLTILSAPVLLLVSMTLGWLLTGRMLAPVNQIGHDVAAITDGRALHRRVVVEGDVADEIVRLAQSVNEMIGRLETSFGSLRRFTADASHELRTPLAVIRADVERAMHTQTNSHEHAVALEEALQQVSRMTGLVESLLTLARADEGRFALMREPVPLEPLIREVAETATILGEEPGVTVKLPVIQPVTVHGDGEHLRQLFLNLATNAVKYTPRGGSVEISLESRHDEAIITVKDDGIGIAAADLPFIFDRFWRVDRARSRTTGGGAGLGLAICQWIAHAHQGRIDVSSRLGRGSTFTIVLPTGPGPELDEPTPNSGLSKS